MSAGGAGTSEREERCASVHGHRYEVEAAVQAAGLDQAGLALDLAALDAVAEGRVYARVWEAPTPWAQHGPVGAPLPAPRHPGS